MYLPEEIWNRVLDFTEFKGNFVYLRTVNKTWYTFGKLEQCNTSMAEITSSVSRIMEALQYSRGSKYLKRFMWCHLGENISDHRKLDAIARTVLNYVPWDPLSASSAGSNNNLDFIKWLKRFNQNNENNLKWDPDLCTSSAALEGNLSFMISMYKLGHIPSQRSSQLAAITGAIPVLSWLKSIGCRMDDVTQYLAEEGHLDGLKWANSNGIMCDEHTLDAAAYGGSLQIVIYIIENIEIPTRKTLESAACGGSSMTFDYLARRYPQFLDDNLLNLAARYGEI